MKFLEKLKYKQLFIVANFIFKQPSFVPLLIFINDIKINSPKLDIIVQFASVNNS